MLNSQKSYTSQKTVFLPLYYYKVLSPIFKNISEQIWLDKSVFNNVNRLNHSSPMSNTVTNKIKHFPQFFA